MTKQLPDTRHRTEEFWEEGEVDRARQGQKQRRSWLQVATEVFQKRKMSDQFIEAEETAPCA